ncbi:hypothetical protein QQF64_032109 [Cirrhinus molitorella]|uniref:Uncharacterized protein n=1 Tax=Cirrhinus molitorella TaxID=172907 RepID=A0ABR3MYX3_9TELE
MFHRALSAAAPTAGIIYSHRPPDTLTSAHITPYFLRTRRSQASGHHSAPFNFSHVPNLSEVFVRSMIETESESYSVQTLQCALSEQAN